MCFFSSVLPLRDGCYRMQSIDKQLDLNHTWNLFCLLKDTCYWMFDAEEKTRQCALVLFVHFQWYESSILFGIDTLFCLPYCHYVHCFTCSHTMAVGNFIFFLFFCFKKKRLLFFLANYVLYKCVSLALAAVPCISFFSCEEFGQHKGF